MTQTKPSKTALKREHLARQELGEQLIGLRPDELRQLPIDDQLRDAVVVASAIRSHGALRRQKQLIGKLMRQVDPDPIRRALDARGADEKLAKRVFALAEHWRDRIVREGRTAIEALEKETGVARDSLLSMSSDLHGTANERDAKAIRRRIFRDVYDALLARARDDRIPR